MTVENFEGIFAIKTFSEIRDLVIDTRKAAMRLIEKAKAENRNMSKSEISEYDVLNKQLDVLHIELEKSEKIEAERKAEAGVFLRSQRTDSTAPKSEFRYSDGRPIEVYDRNRPVQKIDGAFGSFGEFAKAIIGGTKNDDQRRSLETGSGSGSYSVPLNIQKEIVDMLRAELVLTQAGARILNLEPGTTRIIKVTADNAPTWHQENADITPGDATFIGVDVSPKTIVSLSKISRELLMDSVNVEAAITTSMINSIKTAIEQAAFTGSGATGYQPTGLDSWAGVLKYWEAANGASLTDFAELTAVDYQLRKRNVIPNGMITSPAGFAALNLLITGSEKNPLVKPGNLATLPIFSTPAISEIETRGTSTTSTTGIWVANWADLLICIRQDVQVEILKELYRGSDSIGFLTTMRCDILPIRPASFAKLGGILPGVATLQTS